MMDKVEVLVQLRVFGFLGRCWVSSWCPVPPPVDFPMGKAWLWPTALIPFQEKNPKQQQKKPLYLQF